MPLLAVLLILSSFTNTATAEEPLALPFPAAVLQHHAEGAVMRLHPTLLRSLQERSQVRLEELPWGTGLDLDLKRCPVPLAEGALHVNGQPQEPELLRSASFWSGRVVSSPQSEAFLAFVAGTCWGWVKIDDQLIHLLSQPDALGDWSSGTVRMISERSLREQGSFETRTCLADQLTPPLSASATAAFGSSRASATVNPVLQCNLALETDSQYFDVFGDLEVAQGYSLALIAAANSRFREQAGVVLVLNYLGFHTGGTDPWTTQEQGGNCIDLLYEFQAAWSNGGAPVSADLHHIFSGVDLGCGVAFLDSICDSLEGFSVMSRMDGLTPFPVAVNPLNWDFIWMCHELGHNFGSIHTHAYCPPLDECPPQSLWGPCQDEVLCTTQGTMMSYCHACPGQMANFTTWFHPVVADVMRTAAEASCLALFEGVISMNLGLGLPGGAGQPNLTLGYVEGPDELTLDLDQAPPSSLGLIVTSPQTAYLPFLGGTLVPQFDLFRFLTTTPSGSYNVSVPITMSFPNGGVLYSQIWLVDPSAAGGFSASNAVVWELIRP